MEASKQTTGKVKPVFIVGGFCYNNVKQAYNSVDSEFTYEEVLTRIESGLSVHEAVLGKRRGVKAGGAYNNIIDLYNPRRYKEVPIRDAVGSFVDLYDDETTYLTVKKTKIKFKKLRVIKLEKVNTPGQMGSEKKGRRKKTKRAANCVVGGKTYKSYKEAYNDIKPKATYELIMQRMKSGEKPDEAFRDSAPREREVTVHGVCYKSVYEAYTTLGSKYTYGAVCRKILRGENPDNTMYSPKESGIYIFEKRYASIKEAYDDIKPEVSYVTVINRIKSGKSLEEAFTSSRKDAADFRGVAISVNGVGYRSISEACEKLAPDKSYSYIRVKLKQGIPAEEVFGIKAGY